MDNIEELMYKIVDEDYNLTEEDKRYLTISSFILAKERIIKKDINNDMIFFDCRKKDYIPLIIELGNIIKDQLIRDNRSLDQTVSVELVHKYNYKKNQEELKKAIYYVHRLRDWLVHKDYQLIGDKLIIRPFASDRFHPDKEYTIELNIKDIEKICKRSSIDFIFDLDNYPHMNHLLKGYNDINEITKGNMKFLIKKDSGVVMNLLHHDEYKSTINKLYSISDKIISNKKIPSRYELIDMSTYSNNKLDYDSFQEIVNICKQARKHGFKNDLVFIIGKTYSDGETLLRGILKDLNISEKAIERNNYFIAALYNYAVNAYAERDKSRPNPKFFDLKGFEIEKIENHQYDEKNKSIIKTIKGFNDNVERQIERLNNVSDSYVIRNIILRLFNTFCNLYTDEIEGYLELQKGIITTGIRNSIDHGNILIDPISSELVLYDLEDNTKELNDNNSKIKICSSVDTFHKHIDEYRNGTKTEYTLGRMISDLKQLTNNSKEIIRFEDSIKKVLQLSLEREIDLDSLTLLDASKEVKDRLIEKTANVIRTIK